MTRSTTRSQPRPTLATASIASVMRIGDCNVPASIAAAIYAGHRYARELDAPSLGEVPFKRERELA